MITMAEQVRAMEAAGESRAAMAEHLRRLYPNYSPTYLAVYVKQVLVMERRRQTKSKTA